MLSKECSRHVEGCGEGSAGPSKERLAFWRSPDGGLDSPLGLAKDVRAHSS